MAVVENLEELGALLGSQIGEPAVTAQQAGEQSGHPTPAPRRHPTPRRAPQDCYTTASAPDGSLHLSTSRAARIALTRAEVFVVAIPLVTTQPSTLTSQVQLEPPGSSLRQYEIELTMRLIPCRLCESGRHSGVGAA